MSFPGDIESHAVRSRRQFLGSCLIGAGALSLGPRLRAAGASDASAAFGRKSPFAQRGYYLTFMRMPTYGRSQWRQILDCLVEDSANHLILWMAGGFRSKQFPVTWRFNTAHSNVRKDFGRQLIADAHRRGIRVLLGFTPFGYDGVNQYTLEHPELKARKKNGQPTDKFGIYSWGWNLCPSRPESQAFMLAYAREMFFEFYPEADGLFIESSDYAICECPDCRGRFFEREFEFVQSFSEEVWKRNQAATVVVYPHYFSGSRVPGFDATAATRSFDPRWSLCFTPHSAHFDARLIQQARCTLWSDDSPALRDPEHIQRNAQRALQAGVTGYLPSLEAFTYIAAEPEEGQRYLMGRRQVPLGFGWLKPDQMPYAELPMRVNRIAYREFAREPALPFPDFKRRLGLAIFGPDAATPESVEDLLLLQRTFFQGRTWRQASPITSPARVAAMKERGELNSRQLEELRAQLAGIRQLRDRHRRKSNPASREIRRLADWIVTQWAGPNDSLLK